MFRSSNDFHVFKSGPRECRLSYRQIQTVSDHWMSLNGKMPRGFARQPGSLYYLDRWKATELRQFLYNIIIHRTTSALKRVI